MLNTTARMMTYTDVEFHEVIADAYKMVNSWDKQISYMEAALPNLKKYDLWNIRDKYAHNLEIKKAARQRVKAWARRMVTLRYCTK
jgi:hypothetical protein